MEHVHKGKKHKVLQGSSKRLLGRLAKQPKTAGPLQRAFWHVLNPMNFHDIPIKDPAIFVTLGAQQQDQALENGVHALRP